MYDVVIIGAGLAGLTAALELSGEGLKIALIEKGELPRHKVCGEYISNEVRPYLESLGIDLSDAEEINHLHYSSRGGKAIQTDLPLGGFGISRYTLDYRMWQSCLQTSVEYLNLKADQISFSSNPSERFPFELRLHEGPRVKARVVLSAHGKRSALDKNLHRSFMEKKSSWVAFKEHYSHPSFPKGRVELHSFKGGYCGLSRTEKGEVNLCFLMDKRRLNQGADRKSLEQVLSENSRLQRFLAEGTPCFEKPLSIAQIRFGAKPCVENHLIYIGDSAGLIHPLCGNGMAMAITSARISAQLCRSFLRGDMDRNRMEKSYVRQWNKQFRLRIYAGRYIQHLIQNESLSKTLFPLFKRSPVLLQNMVSLTHGKTIPV